MWSPRTRDWLKRRLYQVFRLGQLLGVDVLPRHFYSSVPAVRDLESTWSWREASQMPGVRGTDVETQVVQMRRWFTPEVRESLARTDVYAAACELNRAVGYGPMEAQFLHAFIAAFRPQRIVQIGAGVSTAIILDAAESHGVDVSVTCVDPFPTDLLVALSHEGEINLVREPAQDVSLDVFTDLGPNDLLFVDSTHTVKVGSEVNRLVLEVFPRLRPGVVIHVHDVMFPYDYPVDLLQDRLFFWDESTLLHAWLIDNDRASILLSESMLAHIAPAQLAEVLSNYRPAPVRDGLFDGPRAGEHFPSATWIQTN